MFFKHEEILPWFFGGFGVLAAIFLYNQGIAEIDIRIKNLVNFSKPPKDDTAYQDINSDAVLTYDHHRMTLQFISDEPIKTWYKPTGELIVITERVKGNSHSDIYEGSVRCSKLNLDGDVVDTLSYVRNRKGSWEGDYFFAGYIWI